MDWLAPIDNYCERTDASALSEPLNAITNAAFLLAAWLLWKRYKQSGARDVPVMALTAMVGVVGVGSFGFHTLANGITMLGDVLPILIFVLLYIGFGFKRLAGFSGFQILAVYGVFFGVASQLGRVPPEWAFNGSVAYAPCLLVLLGLAGFAREARVRRELVISAGVFLGSLFFRSVDMAWCEALPVGTHFLWHSLNGVLLFRLVRSMMQRTH